MAKIKKELIEVKSNSQRQYYNVDIEYSDHVFFVLLPKELEIIVSGYLDLIQELGLHSKYDRSRNFKGYAIEALTEKALLNVVRATFSKILGLAQIKRNVIILYYEKNDSQAFKPGSDVDFIGYTISYKICVEVKTSGVEKPKFIDGNGNDLYVGHRLGGVVLEDTTENRAIVSKLYEASKELVNKLEELTKTPETFSLISKGLKLLQ